MLTPEFESYHQRIIRSDYELPPVTSIETEIKTTSSRQLVYEAIYLIKWAKSKNIPICKEYQPVITPERKKINLLNEIRGLEIISLSKFAELLALYNNYEDENHFIRMLILAQKTNKIIPFAQTKQQIASDFIVEPENYEYEISLLLTWAHQKNFSLPIEMTPQSPEESDPRSIGSLQKMVLGMAINKYGYDPLKNKNSATGTNTKSIGEDLSTVGLGLSDDTIRNILQKASEKYREKIPSSKT
ncbi:MAG: hypothetical protein QM652_06110 [Legionella sp.]|uniref:hypothetical protein n=1 Tax=Legionella sp. TaxID=459 RepID=UPI0039E21B79